MKSAVLGIVLLVLFGGGISAAQSRMSASNAKPAILGKVGIDQKIGAMVPANLPFKDESGQTVRLGKFFGNRPIVLVLVYYQCPMLCTLVLNDLLRTMRQMPDSVGKDYDVLTVSFDPRDTPELAAAKKKNYLKEYGRAGAAAAGWHFLTGEQSSIGELTHAVGFFYRTKVPSHRQATFASLLPDIIRNRAAPPGDVARNIYAPTQNPIGRRRSVYHLDSRAKAPAVRR